LELTEQEGRYLADIEIIEFLPTGKDRFRSKLTTHPRLLFTPEEPALITMGKRTPLPGTSPIEYETTEWEIALDLNEAGD
jgi:hypothetical protein